ncbi:hypothetical protein PV11_09689 [Exophiala sideris]|uniref:Cytochrome P450 n=1 Tax=Exophiala sideris TaxID=1016849 RepID=A0A0D1Y513_9EURO|nr:hypothetical protein PV11_09689 [Exophiala sideris]
MLSSLAILVFLVLLYVIVGRKGNWPDGPRGPFMFGTLQQKKKKLHWNQELASHIPHYGDFFSINMGKAKVVVLSSPTAVDDLIVKRGQKYSSRPSSSPTGRIVAQSRLGQTPYGEEFRRHRKLVHSILGMQNAKIFMPYQEYESRQVLKNLLDQPTTFYTEVHRYSASVTFSLLLGARFVSPDTKIPREIQNKMYEMFAATRPGYWFADRVPLLNYLPDALAPWRAKAHRIFDHLIEFWGVFYDSMEERIKKGDAPDCFIKRFLESPEVVDFTEIDRRIVLSELLSAGAETTATNLQWFFKAAVLYPEAVKKAQQELDEVIGRDRFPTWEDRQQLPYIVAFVDELHRWGSPSPLAFYHATSEVDTYRGKTIPAQTTVIYNAGAIHHSDMYYRQHKDFIPERFLPEKDTRHMPNYAHAQMHYGYGVGRRECPGKHVAESSLFIVISRILWAFDIGTGSHPLPGPETAGSIPILAPAKFHCVVTPRDQSTASKIGEEAKYQDPSLRVEDAAQYEDDVAKVVARQKAEALGVKEWI